MDFNLTDDEILELNDFQHARLRTEMYFGSRVPLEETIIGFDGEKLVPQRLTFVPALATAQRELLDNALDEIKKCRELKLPKKFGTTVRITFDPETLTFSVEDDGRGVPPDKIETVFTKARAGRNFKERGEVAGTNGIGASVVAFTSQFFRVTVWRDGKEYYQEFSENPIDDSELAVSRQVVKSCAAGKHGTRVEFRPSPEVFKDLVIPEEFVKSRIYEIAAINPDLKVFYNDQQFKFPQKLSSGFLKGLDPVEIHIDEPAEGFSSSFYLVPQFLPGQDEMAHSVVNNICSYHGGAHISAFRSVFYNGLLDALSRESKRRKLKPNKSDVSVGLLIYNVTRMRAPNFDNQAKTRLTNQEADRLVRKNFDETLFKKLIKLYPSWIEDIYERCAERTMKKDLADAKKKSAANTKVKVAKLMDANCRDRSKCVLLIAEGDSAINGIRDAREPEIHGGLPLRGKFINVNGESPATVAKSMATSDIMNAIGLQIGVRAIRSQLRYGKVYVATDEDEDGKNIMALVVNFLFTYWPELFDPDMPPFVYRFDTPFIICKKGKQRQYFYAHNYAEFDPKEWKGWDITRAKGLSTLMTEDWKHALANPMVTPIVDDIVDGKSTMREALDLIFSDKRPDDRKLWLEN